MGLVQAFYKYNLEAILLTTKYAFLINATDTFFSSKSGYKDFFSFLKKLANGINEFTKLGVTANCATERK